MILDLAILMLVLLYIAVMKRYFFPARQRQKRASYSFDGQGESTPADGWVDGDWPDTGYEHGRDQIEEGTPFLERARTGEARAGTGGGMRHGVGSSLSENDARAVESYRSAALRGSSEGQVNLGYVYCLGLGVKKNYRQAMRWFEQAVGSGDVRGKAGLAWLLATCPDGRIRDGQRAIEVLWPVVDGRQKDPALLDVLAAACAEAGLFPAAVELVTEAMEQVDRASEGALYEQMARRLRFYRSEKAWREPSEETDSEERPDDEGEERGRRVLKASSKGRRIAPAKPTKTHRRDKPVQSPRRGRTTEGPMQQVGPKGESASKAVAAPSSGLAKEAKAQGVPATAEAKALPAAAPSRPATARKTPVAISENPLIVPEKPAALPKKQVKVPKKQVKVPKKPAELPSRPVVPVETPVILPEKPSAVPENPVSLPSRPAGLPKAVSPSEERIRSTDAAGSPEKPRREQAAPGKPTVRTAPSLDRQEALDVSNLIVGALVSGRYEEMYAAMSGTYRDAVSEEAVGAMIEQMYAVSGGRMVAAELAGDEAGFYREAGGEETAKRTFRYSVFAENKKEKYPFFVEVVREGGRPVCADFFYAVS